MATYSKTTNVIIHDLYPVIAKSLSTNTNKFKAMIAEFINRNHNNIYDIAPYDNIYYGQRDKDELFTSLNITENQVIDIMKDCFYWKSPYNPQCAKEPYIVVLVCAIRYFLLNKKMKEAEITAIYLAFSGKMYASLYGGVAFPKAPPSKYRSVMDYVINNMLTSKFNLRSKGNMFGAIQSLCQTWLDTYIDALKDDPDDDDIGKMLQQLRGREKSFLMNIAKLYYQAYENKNYLNYESDNLTADSKEFRITDNNAIKAARYTENTVNYLMTNNVSLELCNKCKDQNIRATEVKSIMESILGDKKNINAIYRVVNILICDFIKNNPDGTVGGIDFIGYTIKAKPNIKEKYVLEMRSIILGWLNEDDNYRRRKSRKATAISYYKALLMYFTLAICKSVN